MFEDGSINKIVSGVESPATVHYVSKRRNYARVYYRENGAQHGFYLHRLVASAFIPNPNRYQQVNHIDGDTKNNRVENLEWVSPSMNMKHAYKTGLINPYSAGKKCSICGEKMGNSSTTTICNRCYLFFMENPDKRPG